MASKPPLALEWLVFLRNCGADLKLSKEARVLSAVLPTYGEGKKIFATMVTLAKVTGMKRETVRNARRELQDKGLLEDITGDPAKQERTYRLSMPGYVSETNMPKVVPERTTPGPQEDHPLVPERTTPGPQGDHNIKLVDQEEDQALHHHHGPGDDDVAESPSGEGPSAPGQNIILSDDDKMFIAKSLGLVPGCIGQNFWDWVLITWCSAAAEDQETAFLHAVDAAAEAALRGRSPAGLFMRILPQHHARIQAQIDDGTWIGTDDYYVCGVVKKAFNEYNSGSPFSAEDITSWIPENYQDSDLTARALARLARVWDLKDNGDGTYSFPEPLEDDEQAA